MVWCDWLTMLISRSKHIDLSIFNNLEWSKQFGLLTNLIKILRLRVCVQNTVKIVPIVWSLPWSHIHSLTQNQSYFCYP